MPAFTQVKTLSRAVPAFTQVKILSRAVSWKKSVPAVKMASRATHVLGLVPIFKRARQKDKCKRAVQCRAVPKKSGTVPSASRAQNVIVLTGL